MIIVKLVNCIVNEQFIANGFYYETVPMLRHNAKKYKPLFPLHSTITESPRNASIKSIKFL